MKILVVVTHPRQDSLTGSITKQLARGLAEAGHEYEVADLYAEGFNPLVYPPDEPDWDNPNKVYSAETMREIERIRNHDAIIFVFPLWWFGVPAMLKGYIDRIWNNGFAYGKDEVTGERFKLPVQKISWVSLVGGTQPHFEKHEHDVTITRHLNYLAGYVGVKDSAVHYLYETIAKFPDDSEKEKHHYDALLAEAYRLGLQF
ncbi:NAD(P)H oxidoreductase [Paenibacillus sp. NPDC058174]|uniref:NAD(P)H oxidoreductase n=1 Tax=Paenibacillus sp. NPDC058174 TaxID=3346366 RepID=UPI0036DEBDB4